MADHLIVRVIDVDTGQVLRIIDAGALVNLNPWVVENIRLNGTMEFLGQYVPPVTCWDPVTYQEIPCPPEPCRDVFGNEIPCPPIDPPVLCYDEHGVQIPCPEPCPDCETPPDRCFNAAGEEIVCPEWRCWDLSGREIQCPDGLEPSRPPAGVNPNLCFDTNMERVECPTVAPDGPKCWSVDGLEIPCPECYDANGNLVTCPEIPTDPDEPQPVCYDRDGNEIPCPTCFDKDGNVIPCPCEVECPCPPVTTMPPSSGINLGQLTELGTQGCCPTCGRATVVAPDGSPCKCACGTMPPPVIPGPDPNPVDPDCPMSFEEVCKRLKEAEERIKELENRPTNPCEENKVLDICCEDGVQVPCPPCIEDRANGICCAGSLQIPCLPTEPDQTCYDISDPDNWVEIPCPPCDEYTTVAPCDDQEKCYDGSGTRVPCEPCIPDPGSGICCDTNGFEILCPQQTPLQIFCPPDSTWDDSVALQFTATGGAPPYTFSAPTLAAVGGLSIDPSTGIIIGLPQSNGVFQIRGYCTDSDGETVHCDFELTVNTVCVENIPNNECCQNGIQVPCCTEDPPTVCCDGGTPIPCPQSCYNSDLTHIIPCADGKCYENGVEIPCPTLPTPCFAMDCPGDICYDSQGNVIPCPTPPPCVHDPANDVCCDGDGNQVPCPQPCWNADHTFIIPCPDGKCYENGEEIPCPTLPTPCFSHDCPNSTCYDNQGNVITCPEPPDVDADYFASLDVGEVASFQLPQVTTATPVTHVAIAIKRTGRYTIAYTYNTATGALNYRASLGDINMPINSVITAVQSYNASYNYVAASSLKGLVWPLDYRYILSAYPTHNRNVTAANTSINIIGSRACSELTYFFTAPEGGVISPTASGTVTTRGIVDGSSGGNNSFTGQCTVYIKRTA